MNKLMKRINVCPEKSTCLVCFLRKKMGPPLLQLFGRRPVQHNVHCIDNTEFSMALSMCVPAGSGSYQDLLSPPVSALEVEALAGINWTSNGVSPSATNWQP